MDNRKSAHETRMHMVSKKGFFKFSAGSFEINAIFVF